MSMPVSNAVPRQRAIPRNMSSARLKAPVFYADVWGSVPTSRPRPDTTINRRRKDNLKNKYDREGKRADLKNEGGGYTESSQEDKGKDLPLTSPLLPERRPSGWSNGAGVNNHCNKRTIRGRGVICWSTPQPWRSSNSRRSIGTRFVPTLIFNLMEASGTMRFGRGGGVTSR